MGLFAKNDEYPKWTNVVDSIDGAVWWVFALIIGIMFIVLGETPGRIIGIVFTAIWIGVGIRAIRRSLK